MMWDNFEGAIIPYTLRQNLDKTWVADCKFCAVSSASRVSALTAGNEIKGHACGDGDHYDPISGLYYSPAKLEEVRKERAERRRILGSHEDTMNLNQAGL